MKTILILSVLVGFFSVQLAFATDEFLQKINALNTLDDTLKKDAFIFQEAKNRSPQSLAKKQTSCKDIIDQKLHFYSQKKEFRRIRFSAAMFRYAIEEHTDLPLVAARFSIIGLEKAVYLQTSTLRTKPEELDQFFIYEKIPEPYRMDIKYSFSAKDQGSHCILKQIEVNDRVLTKENCSSNKRGIATVDRESLERYLSLICRNHQQYFL